MNSEKRKPNIILILSDDQGYWAMGCSGNHEIKTPNLDRMAEQGMRMDSMFCASPVCSPARASIMTGTIPSRNGVQDWIQGGNLKEGGISYLEGITAYTDVLAKNGYVCGISGKWHLGNSFMPQKSFSHWYVHQKGSGNYYDAPMVRNGEAVNEPGYITDVITDDAIGFIESHKNVDDPFYLSVHYTAPHNPWDEEQHPKEYRDLYKDCPFDTAVQEPFHPDAVYRYTPEDAKVSLIGYYASITAMDHNIGRIFNCVRCSGLSENTLVIFTSDNGFACGQHGIWGKGNGTLSLNMYDTSVKVPAIFWRPGHIPAGVVSKELMSHYDLMPTLLEYCGINYQDETLPGRSFAPLLRGKPCVGREEVVIYDEYGPVRMIRTKEWKYVHRYPYGSHELFHLTDDPDERENLVERVEYASIVEDMRLRLTRWFVRYVNPEIDAVREPVRGNGQICRPGIYSGGKIAFDQGRMIKTDPSDDPGSNDFERSVRKTRR